VVAIDDVTVMEVTRDSLTEALALDSWMGAFVVTLAERFRDLDAQLTTHRREHLRLVVREQLLASLAGHTYVPWPPLLLSLLQKTGLAELDILAIVAASDEVTLDERTSTLRANR
jgi:hypothetical protein